GSGVTAAVVVLALATLDVPDVTLYDGAWSEWGARTDLPVEPALISAMPDGAHAYPAYRSG
ncbi:hypothetical protein OV522_26735, partial [Salmonella enterica subsp. enterica serovar 1,4,[5],12:i:-]|nr:hypothetical protein [Salmonella enterica subsp. enterica serovar 1,4,[5],12:i:-]